MWIRSQRYSKRALRRGLLDDVQLQVNFCACKSGNIRLCGRCLKGHLEALCPMKTGRVCQRLGDVPKQRDKAVVLAPAVEAMQ